MRGRYLAKSVEKISCKKKALEALASQLCDAVWYMVQIVPSSVAWWMRRRALGNLEAGSEISEQPLLRHASSTDL
jgi:hypothetical protein